MAGEKKNEKAATSDSVELVGGPQLSTDLEVTKELICGRRSKIRFHPIENPIVSKPDFHKVLIPSGNLRFFFIKLDGEDDFHKSFTYSVWSCNQKDGNSKLNEAFHAPTKGNLHIYLFFSIQGSEQFVGFCEMTGGWDPKKGKNFWQQEGIKKGSFPVSWRIIKDIPNESFEGMTTIEGNLVTTASDTEEIELHHGLEMCKIFNEYPATTCLDDDLVFYEYREFSLWMLRGLPSAEDLDNDIKLENDVIGNVSVEIFREDVLENVKQVNQAFTMLKPYLSKNGILCEFKEDKKFELSRYPGVQNVSIVRFEYAVRAITALTEGVDAKFAIKVLVGELDMLIIRKNDFFIREKEWIEKKEAFRAKYETMVNDPKMQKQMPPVLIYYEDLKCGEQRIRIMGTPVGLVLMGAFIRDFIDSCADFEELAIIFLRRYKDYMNFPGYYLWSFLRPPYRLPIPWFV